MRIMTEPFSSIFTAKGLVTLSGFFLAGLSNAIISVQKNGWKGIWMFIGGIVVALSSGQIVYSFLMAVGSSLALPCGFAAAYMGPSAVEIIWSRFISKIFK